MFTWIFSERIERVLQSLKGILRFEQVEYKTVKEISDTIVEKSLKVLNELRGLRKWIVESMPSFDEEKIEKMCQYCFHQM